MLCRVLPRALDLWGVGSPALLTLCTGRRETTPLLPWTLGHTKPQLSLGTTGVTGHCCLSTGQTLSSKDSEGYANDPQVKEWMKELHKDFTYQPKEQKESLVSDKTKEGEEGQEEENLTGDRTDEEKKRKETVNNPQKVWSQLVAEKYQKLETHTQIIYDYDEERQRREAGLVEEEVKQEKVKLKRGETGVFDVEELVDLLREDNAQDIVVIQIPPEVMYVDYMVIVSSASQRHRTALAWLVKGAYKLKKSSKDPSVLMEGKGSDWVAMDMGNIVLHIMDPETRESYDLETLWTVGAAFDEKAQVSEEDLVGVRRPRDPMAPPPSPPVDNSTQAVT